MYYYGARYYNYKESVWLSADLLSGYNPNNETEHYIDGQHNGGVYNSFNLNTYGYCYQSPVKLVDPNGKQASSVYGLDSAELLNSSNFNTSTSKMTGAAFYGTGRTLNYLGNNNVLTRGKLANTTKGTSIASQYFREKFGNKLLPKPLRLSGENLSRINKPLGPIYSNNLGGAIGRLTPVVGRGLVVVGVGMSIYNISISDNKPIAAIRELGIWGGAIAGAESGAILGEAIGGPLGAAAGGILGGIAGESAVNSLLEPITPCGSCIRPSDNYLESGMRIDGGLRAIKDRINQNQQNLNN
ncbi:hypothetical protein [Apibacter mensalis]|uniref:hypothetical protein n=1 Tax=Apibacter mensalis TaxID=1586267 RepID=UPI0026EABE28|nr:hypothetical protein [Apibacter mensalis]